MITLDKLQSTDFIPHLNSSFSIRLEGIDPIELEMVSVTELGEKFKPPGRQPFSIHFLGPVSPQYLTQHIYSLHHPHMGTLELFLVPLGPEKRRMRYEAILT